jgi:sulfonate transport system ATP-binding protein
VVLLDGELAEFHPAPAPRKRGDADAAHLKAAILDSLHV